MTKATNELYKRPYKVTHSGGVHITRLYVYIGSLQVNYSGFFGSGSMFKKTEIVKKSSGLQKPFTHGDAFVKYSDGIILVLDSTLPKHKIMRTANKQEITALKQAIRTVERQLRWRTGAYCEGETRQIFKKKTPVTLTSNTEAIRRAKNNSTRQGKSKEALSCK